MSLEKKFNITFTAALATKEKQIQQNYRPFIGIHKWFARRPGTVFRNLFLSEFNAEEGLETSYWRAHEMRGIIADPFMGGGTPLLEANRLGFDIVGADINPMSFWIVRQSLVWLDLSLFKKRAETLIDQVEKEIGGYYTTKCVSCGDSVPVKYFMWVKTQECPACSTANDLFPGYLLAENRRHPAHVIACRYCGCLNEYESRPERDNSLPCRDCGRPVFVEGPALHNKITCQSCGTEFRYPLLIPQGAPSHRMWAIEYFCSKCKIHHKGRFFKKPDNDDLLRLIEAEADLKARNSLLIPEDPIPDGDETKRLHRWGYSYFREMFNSRQLLGLSILLDKIRRIEEDEIRYALLTVFSDFLRYQNMLCRYDTYALKCQDIFSVHGFPVALIQCENSLLGIPRIGAGAFRHFIVKYVRAKEYCLNPFETLFTEKKKMTIPILGERIRAELVNKFPSTGRREAQIQTMSAEKVHLPPASLDGVFTDPPYYDNVQYAELMDFCYVWLRLALRQEFPVFAPTSTRTNSELTGNNVMERGIESFTKGLSSIYRHYAAALKRGAPFVFTYHHNNPQAYVPIIVAILDAGLDCTATFPAPAEMGASLHIARSKSSVLDSIFICRTDKAVVDNLSVAKRLRMDARALRQAGLTLTMGDIQCLATGHVARLAINKLRKVWNVTHPLKRRIAIAERCLSQITADTGVAQLVADIQKLGEEPRRVSRAASF